MIGRSRYRLRLFWHGTTEPARSTRPVHGPVLLSGLVASGGLLVDQAMAAMLPSGSVFRAGLRQPLCQRGHYSLGRGGFLGRGAALSRALIAHADGLAAAGTTLRTWVRITAARLHAIALALIAGSHLLIRTAFQHGVFSPADTALVHAGAGHVRHPDSFLRLQPRLLPFSGCHAPHRPDLLLPER